MQPQQPVAPQNYDFIFNPQQPNGGAGGYSGGGSSSLIKRVLVVSGGLLVLLIAFIVLKGILISGPNVTPLLTVLSDQNQLAHLAEGASEQPNLSLGNQNFTATASLSMASARSETLSYLTGAGQKIKIEEINRHLDPALDTQLTAAKASSTYDQVYHDIMQTALTNYQKDLKQAFAQSTGKNGRALLSAQYDGSELLVTQLNTK